MPDPVDTTALRRDLTNFIDDEIGTYEVDAEKPGDHGGDDAL